MTKLIIVGSKGRMGQALVRLASDAGCEVVALIDRGDTLESSIARTDAVIEFAHHSISEATAQLCASHGKALVLGTTGHSNAEQKTIEAAAKKVPIVWAPNFSVGVNLLFALTQKAAEVLGPDYDREIVELHHRMKVDAPSGTAKRLGEILAQAQKADYEKVVRHGRSGETGKRSSTEIGMHAFRGGDIVGEHTVYFAGIGERIELTHRAASRDTFASGALRAATWAVKQKPGLYSMQDVLGL
jgi:4-hydroxy-tetrahydrodipicolinate reductase